MGNVCIVELDGDLHPEFVIPPHIEVYSGEWFLDFWFSLVRFEQCQQKIPDSYLKRVGANPGGLCMVPPSNILVVVCHINVGHQLSELNTNFLVKNVNEGDLLQ